MLESLHPLLLSSIAIGVGIAGLVWGADRFVASSATIARAFGITPLIIGLTIVSIGTSAPEIMVSLSAALRGAGEIAIGNALGSNIANIGLVLGCTLLIAKIPVEKSLARQEMPILLAVTAIAGLFLYDSTLTLIEGIILLSLIVPAILFLIIVKKNTPEDGHENTPQEPQHSLGFQAFIFIAGLATLILSAELLVWGATTTATAFKVDPLIIGLTVVAVGTSLPELAASVASALKGHHDIALGNIIGSNLFNLLTVMSLPALFSPLHIDSSVFIRDYSTMAFLTGLIALICFWGLYKSKGSNNKSRHMLFIKWPLGLMLLGCYAVYYVLLFFTV